MGFTLDDYGKPTFDATPQTVLDLQAVADFARKYAFATAMTASQRNALTSTQRIDGMLITDTDTDELWRWGSGVGWECLYKPLKAYTPNAVVGLTVGNGTLTTRYQRVGKIIDVILELVSGSTTAVTSTITVSLPETPENTSFHRFMGHGHIRTVAGNFWPIVPRMAGVANVRFAGLDASGAAVALGTDVNTTFPTAAAWSGASVQPQIYAHFQYIAAS